MIEFYFLLLVLIMVVCIIIAVVSFLYNRSQYHKSSYHQNTHTPYSDLLFDKGIQGECRVALSLAPFQYQSARLLHNLYLPTTNGNTTEVDSVLITHSGVFVIEVKNLSGWIFGDADQKYWCQSLPASHGSRKHTFYNPIWQNGTHIRALRQLIDQNVPYYSIIVFPDHCTLKQITLRDARANIVYVSELASLIKQVHEMEENRLSDTDIFKIYTKLYPYAHVDNETKARHVYNVSKKRQ